MPRTIKKETIINLVATAVPNYEATKPLILEMLPRMIPNDSEADLLEELDSVKVKRIIALYRAYSNNFDTFRLADLLEWWRKDSREVILDLERRMGEIEQLMAQYGDVDPDKDYTISGTDIVNIRFFTFSPLIGTEEK